MSMRFFLFICVVLTTSVALQGCAGAKRKVVESTADCSSVFVYRTSKVRDKTQDHINGLTTDGVRYEEMMAACTGVIVNGRQELLAEAIRINRLATDDRAAGITKWGKDSCENYEAYAAFQIRADDWYESQRATMSELTVEQKECLEGGGSE